MSEWADFLQAHEGHSLALRDTFADLSTRLICETCVTDDGPTTHPAIEIRDVDLVDMRVPDHLARFAAEVDAASGHRMTGIFGGMVKEQEH